MGKIFIQGPQVRLSTRVHNCGNGCINGCSYGWSIALLLVPPGGFIEGDGDLNFRVLAKMSALSLTFREYVMIKRYYIDVTMLPCVGTMVGRKLRNEVQFYRLHFRWWLLPYL